MRSGGYHEAMTDREALILDFIMALRQVPRGTLRDLARRWPPGQNPAERMIAETTVDHLERCRWRVKQVPAPEPRAY